MCDTARMRWVISLSTSAYARRPALSLTAVQRAETHPGYPTHRAPCVPVVVHPNGLKAASPSVARFSAGATRRVAHDELACDHHRRLPGVPRNVKLAVRTA